MIEKDTLIYQQSCEEFRSLNGFFWQIPIIMMTLNGGLWYSVASLDLSTPLNAAFCFLPRLPIL